MGRGGGSGRFVGIGGGRKTVEKRIWEWLRTEGNELKDGLSKPAMEAFASKVPAAREVEHQGETATEKGGNIEELAEQPRTGKFAMNCSGTKVPGEERRRGGGSDENSRPNCKKRAPK